MQKVLFITPSKSIGGTNSSLSSIINQIKDRFDIKVLSMSSAGTGNYEFFNSLFINPLLDSYYSNYCALKGETKLLAIFVKLLKRFFRFFSIDITRTINIIVAKQIENKCKFDIVIGFSEGISMRLASEFKSAKKITWIHCEYDRAVPESIDELPYYQRFDSIACVSKYTMTKFLERYPSLENKTMYIYNLIDLDRISSLANCEIDDNRFKNDLFTLISVGRMDAVKQFSLIPGIAKNLLASGIKFRWYIIGGPINDEYEIVRKSIVKNDVVDNVILLGMKSNPYSYMKSSDLYVSTSLSEACPMVFIEARLCGLPIVSFNFASAYEFIDNNRDGLIVSVDQMPSALKKVISDFTTRSDIDTVRCNLSADNEIMKTKLLQLFS